MFHDQIRLYLGTGPPYWSKYSRGHRMANRKWKESKQQSSMLPGPAVLGCCLISFHFTVGHPPHPPCIKFLPNLYVICWFFLLIHMKTRKSSCEQSCSFFPWASHHHLLHAGLGRSHTLEVSRLDDPYGTQVLAFYPEEVWEEWGFLPPRTRWPRWPCWPGKRS